MILDLTDIFLLTLVVLTIFIVQKILKKNNLDFKQKIFIYFFICFNLYFFNYLKLFNLGVVTDFIGIRYFIFFTEDWFADLTKLVFSYQHLFDANQLFDMNVPKDWIENNPYNKITTEGVPYGFQAPPLFVLITHLLGYILKLLHLQFDMFIFVSYFVFISLYIKFLFSRIKKEDNVVTLFLFLFSYPILFLLQRGNIMSLLLSLITFRLITKFIANEEFEFIDIFLLVFSVSLRPLLFLIGLLFLDFKSLKNSLNTFFKILMTFLITNFIYLQISSLLLDGYNLNSFLKGIRSYSINQISGDGFNSSTFNLLLNIQDNSIVTTQYILNNFDYYYLIQNLILIIYLMVALLTTYFYSKKYISKLSYVSSLVAISIAATHPIGDYHLAIFLLMLLLINKEKDSVPDEYEFYTFIFLLLILPKPHTSNLNVLNPSLLINSVALNLIIFKSIFFYKFTFFEKLKLLKLPKTKFRSLKFITVLKNFTFKKGILKKVNSIFLLIIIGVFVNYIFVNFFKEEPVQLRTIQNACGEVPIDYVKPDISSNPNYVFINDTAYQSRVLWDELSNSVIVNSFIECDHYFTGGWYYFSQEYYLANQEISCTELDKLKDQDLDNGIVYLKNIGLREIFVDKNGLCIGSIQNIRIDGDVMYYEVLYSRAAYLLISQIIPFLFLIYSLNLRWYKFLSILIISQLFSQIIFNFSFGLNLINSVSLFSLLSLIVIKLENKNETKI